LAEEDEIIFQHVNKKYFKDENKMWTEAELVKPAFKFFAASSVKKEEKFLKIVHETKCDTSGLSKYLLCFLRNDLHNISLSYILEYIFKSFISNSKSNSKDDRLIEMLMKKLNVKDISSFIHNSLFSVYSSKNFANT